MQTMTKAIENEGRKVGLFMNDKKCKFVISNAWEDRNEIKIGGLAFETVKDFCYLGSCMTSNGTVIVTKTANNYKGQVKLTVCLGD